MSHNLSQTNALLEKLPPDSRAAIAGLIELKTDSDMDKVLSKLDAMETKFDARLEAMDSKFEAKIDAMNQKIDTKINTLYWLVGLGVTIVIAAIKLF